MSVPLNSNIISSNMLCEPLDELNELSKRNKVTLLWVRQHTGVKRNERQSRYGGQNTFWVGPELFCGSEVDQRRSKYWETLHGLRLVRTLLATYNQKRYSEYINLSKINIRLYWYESYQATWMDIYVNELGITKEVERKFCGVEDETSIYPLSNSSALCNSRSLRLRVCTWKWRRRIALIWNVPTSCTLLKESNQSASCF